MEAPTVKALNLRKTFYIVFTFILILTICFILFFFIRKRFVLDGQAAVVVSGILDLESYDELEELYVVDGWEYYPSYLIGENGNPESKPSSYVNVMTGESVPEQSPAVFRLRITGITEPVGLYIPRRQGMFVTYLNQSVIDLKNTNLLFSGRTIALEPGNDYEVVLEYESYKPDSLFRPFIISQQYFSKRLNNASLSVLLALGIGIFAIAAACILYVLSSKKERTGHIVMIILAVIELVWLIFYSNKYCNTIRNFIPDISDDTIVMVMNLSMSAGIILDLFLTFMIILPAFRKRQPVIIGATAGVTIVIAASILLDHLYGLKLIKDICCLFSLLLLIFIQVLIVLRLRKNIYRQYYTCCALSTLAFGYFIAMIIPDGVMDLLYIFAISGLCIVFHFFLIISILSRNFEQRKELEYTAEAQEKLLQIQGAFWASQIQPHFIYNTLQAIQALCFIDPEKAGELISKFSEHLRRNVDYINTTKLIPFRDELEHVQNYVDIQKVRFGETLNYISDISEDEFMIPPLTVQPLVENAIRYGVRSREKGGTVILSSEKKSDGVHICIIDDGPGFNQSGIKKNGGIENVRNRLKAFAHAELILNSKDGRTVLEILIPENEVIWNADNYS